MILKCRKCGTNYLVADSAIGGAGRTVRCANCGHEWFQAGAASEPEAAEVPIPHQPADQLLTRPIISPAKEARRMRKRPLPEGSNLPVVIVTYHAPAWLRYLCIALLPLVIVLAPFAYRKPILAAHPELSFLYEPFGIYPTDGLALADVTVTRLETADSTDPDDKRLHVTLDCGIINESTGGRTAPALSVVFFNAGGDAVMRAPNMADQGQNIVSGHVLPCKKFSFDMKEGEIDRARLDLADPFDLALRRK